MSGIGSTGIRRRRTPEDRIDEAIDGVADAYLRKARRYSDKALSQGGALGTGPVYGSINPGTNSLQTSGGTMIGSIAFNPIALLVDDGRINIEPDQNEASKDSSYVLVTAQGSPDDLFFIDGADKNGQLLYLQATETQILVLKAATITSIANISGLGTVTVVTTSDHNMLTGAKANILDTDNFNISDVTVIKINATTFTYSATGNNNPETAGIVQNGNIVTPDGNDITLDATISPNGIPIATLIFDPTVEGFGAWRIISVSVVSGTAGDFLRVSGGAMFGSIAYDPDLVFVDSDGRVPITSSYIQSTAETAPNNEVFFFDGALFNGQQLEYQVTNQTIQVIKNAVLKTITNIVGDGSQIITATIDDTSSLVNGDSVNIKDTASYNLENAIITVTGATTFTYDLGSIGATTNETGTMQRGNIVMPDDQDLTLDSNISTLGVAIATFVFDPTVPGGGWRLASSTVSNGGGVNLLPLNNVWTGSNTFEGTPFTVTAAITSLAGTISTSITSPAITIGDEASDALSILATSTFSELATFNNSVVIAGQPFNVTGTLTALSSTISTSITSPLILLGDQASDNISFVGQVNTNIVMEEITEPGNALANTGRFYAKLSSGVSVPFWKDENGLETSMIGGAGDITEPIELGFNEAVVGATTIVAGDVFNPTHISLTQSTTIQLDISTTTTKYKSIFVIFDTTGNDFTVTWPTSVSNPPIIDDSVAQRISVILYTIDNGTTWTNATSVGSSSSVSQWANFPAISDVNMATFDLFNIDNLVFTTGTGSLLDAEVGFTSVATGGLRANILNDAEFRWTEENVLLMKLLESSSKTRLDLTGVLSSEINLFETTSSKAGTILQGTTILQFTTTGTSHEFLVGVESIAKITADGIEMQGANFITTPQIGFSILGNIIEDSTSGLSLKTLVGDGIFFGDGTNVFAESNNTRFDIGLRFYQLGSIASPGVTGSNTIGRVFMDSGNLNHLSIIRNGSVIDLETGGGGTTNEILQGNSFVRVTDPGTGVINFQVDNTGVGSIALSTGWVIDTANLTIASSSGKLVFNNGFEIQNTDANTTTFAIPNDEELIFTEGGESRFTLDNSITMNANLNDDIIFQHNATQSGIYDGSSGDWTFRPENDFIINVTNDFQLQNNGVPIILFDNANVNLTFETDLLFDNGTRIRSNDGEEIGFFVTNFTGSLGSLGGLQIPITTTAPGTATIADGRASAGDGCLLLQDTGSGALVLFARQDNGNWAGVTLARDTLV